LYLCLISFIGGILSSVVGVTSFWLYYGALEGQGKTHVEAQVTSIFLVMVGSMATSAQYITYQVINLEYLQLLLFL